MIWKFSGEKVAAEHQGSETLPGSGVPIMVEGEQYLVCRGRYVPYYPPKSDETVDRETLAMDLSARFLRNAEAGIVVRRTDEEIKRLMKSYETTADARKRATGSLLVGAIVGRMRQLSSDLLEGDRNGRNAAEMQPLQDTLRQLYEYVMVQQPDLIRCVHRRDGTEDIDGVLYEMFSELGKPYGKRIKIKILYEQRALKIGEAINAVEHVAKHMHMAAEHLESEALLKGLIDKLAAAARRRCGIRLDDEAYNDAEIDFKTVQAELAKACSRINTTKPEVLARVNLLVEGRVLIEDMADIRGERKISMIRFAEKAKRLPPVIAKIA